MFSKKETKKSKVIDRLINMDKKSKQKEVKLLLLGAGDSGKSTIAKQLRILHSDNFTDLEKRYYKNTIYNNVKESMQEILKAGPKLGIQIPVSKAVENILKSELDGLLSPADAQNIKELWDHPNIKLIFERRSEFQVSESAPFFFEKVEMIVNENYIPTEEDILRSRIRSTGISEIKFELNDITFKLMDVGGQKSERKKWLHYFDDVTAVLFCVSLNDYNLTMFEDENTNRMTDSIHLFANIYNNPVFAHASIILFLNKKDLFEKKIKEVDLNVCFPEYKGGCDYDKGIKYITDLFGSFRKGNRKIFTHVTCATDKVNIQVVWSAVRTIIVDSMLREIGMTL